MTTVQPLQVAHGPQQMSQPLTPSGGALKFTDLLNSISQKGYLEAAKLTPQIGSSATPFAARPVLAETSLPMKVDHTPASQSNSAAQDTADFQVVSEWIKESVSGVGSFESNSALWAGKAGPNAANASVSGVHSIEFGAQVTKSASHLNLSQESIRSLIPDSVQIARSALSFQQKSDALRATPQQSAKVLASQEFTKRQGQSFFAAILQIDDRSLRVILRGVSLTSQELAQLEGSLHGFLIEQGYQHTQFHITPRKAEMRSSHGI